MYTIILPSLTRTPTNEKDISTMSPSRKVRGSSLVYLSEQMFSDGDLRDHRQDSPERAIFLDLALAVLDHVVARVYERGGLEVKEDVVGIDTVRELLLLVVRDEVTRCKEPCMGLDAVVAFVRGKVHASNTPVMDVLLELRDDLAKHVRVVVETREAETGELHVLSHVAYAVKRRRLPVHTKSDDVWDHE